MSTRIDDACALEPILSLMARARSRGAGGRLVETPDFIGPGSCSGERLDVRRDHPRHWVFVRHVAARRCSKRFALGGVKQQDLDGIGQRVGIRGRDDKSVHAVKNRRRDPARTICHDRNARGHRLERRVRTALVVRERHEHAEAAREGGYVDMRPDEPDAPQPRAPDFVGDIRSVALVRRVDRADDGERDARDARREDLHHVHELLERLAWHDTAARADRQLRVPSRRQRGRRARRDRRHTVRNNTDPIRWVVPDFRRQAPFVRGDEAVETREVFRDAHAETPGIVSRGEQIVIRHRARMNIHKP
jgi:hypothetical protein